MAHLNVKSANFFNNLCCFSSVTSSSLFFSSSLRLRMPAPTHFPLSSYLHLIFHPSTSPVPFFSSIFSFVYPLPLRCLYFSFSPVLPPHICHCLGGDAGQRWRAGETAVTVEAKKRQRQIGGEGGRNEERWWERLRVREEKGGEAKSASVTEINGECDKLWSRNRAGGWEPGRESAASLVLAGKRLIWF